MVASVSACSGPNYYLEIDHALYYLTGENAAGVWHGLGATFLGFKGPVFKEQLIAAFNGLGSDCYTRHVQLPKGRNHQPAWDITFSAPKSVSVLWSLLAADDRHKIETLVMQAAMWLLLRQYNKLTNEEYKKTIAVVTDGFEAGRINSSVQNHRRSAQQLGGDSIEIRQGERVHRGDRVLVTLKNEQGVPRTLLGTAIGFSLPFKSVMKPGGELVTTPHKQWVTFELDSKHQTGQVADAKERITVEEKNFDGLQLGYAATADRLKDVKVDSALVLLPERGESPSDMPIPIQLTRATKDVSLYGESSHYGPLLDEGRSPGDFEKSLGAVKDDGPVADSTTLLDLYTQAFEEHRLQRVQSEQIQQLSQQRSIGL